MSHHCGACLNEKNMLEWKRMSYRKGVFFPVMTILPSSQGQMSYDPRERAAILQEVEARFAPEDQVLRDCVAQMEHPGGQISPTQGKLFQVLALTCGARKILEIGAYAGYS